MSVPRCASVSGTWLVLELTALSLAFLDRALARGGAANSALRNTHSQSCRNSACCSTKSEFLAGQPGEIRTGLLLHASSSVTRRLIYGALMRNTEESTPGSSCSRSGRSGWCETFECWNFCHLLLDPDAWWAQDSSGWHCRQYYLWNKGIRSMSTWRKVNWSVRRKEISQKISLGYLGVLHFSVAISEHINILIREEAKKE